MLGFGQGFTDKGFFDPNPKEGRNRFFPLLARKGKMETDRQNTDGYQFLKDFRPCVVCPCGVCPGPSVSIFRSLQVMKKRFRPSFGLGPFLIFWESFKKIFLFSLEMVGPSLSGWN